MFTKTFQNEVKTEQILNMNVAIPFLKAHSRHVILRLSGLQNLSELQGTNIVYGIFF